MPKGFRCAKIWNLYNFFQVELKREVGKYIFFDTICMVIYQKNVLDYLLPIFKWMVLDIHQNYKI